MAEAIFRHKVIAAGLEERFEIDGAGTGSWHAGEPPHHGTRRILDTHGISYAGQRARQITQADLAHYDYILTMDDSNYSDVHALGPIRGQLVPMLEYAPQVGLTEVPDPYYGGGFEGVYAMLDTACDGLLEAIRKERGF